MKKLFWWAAGIIAIGVLVENNSIAGFGVALLLGWMTWLLLKGTKAAAVSGTRLAVDKYKENQAEKREEMEYQKQLRRELEREKLKAEMQLDIYRKQVDLMIEYKRKGADITKDLFDMRKNLLELESAENKAMVEDLLKTLDSI